MKEFYTTAEVAEKLGLSKPSLLANLRNSEAAKTLPPFLKLPGKYIFPIKQFEAWKASIGGENNE
tara:strand:- start:94 stop:288 length:195 start_codon:yes stop_codon:yes gene_type:complete